MKTLRFHAIHWALASSLALFAACTKKTPELPAGSENVAVEEGAERPPAGPLCPEGIASDGKQPPSWIIDAAQGYKLIACGGVDAEETAGARKGSEFEIFQVTPEGQVFSPALVTAGALENYRLSVDNGVLTLLEQAYFNDDWMPVFVSTVSCSTEGCKRSLEKCAFDKVKAKKTFKPLTSKAKALLSVKPDQKSYPDSREVSALLDAAVTGFEAAKSFFKTLPDGIELDGDSAEEYASARSLIERLEKLKCL